MKTGKKQALVIREKTLEPIPPDVAISLNDLANLYCSSKLSPSIHHLSVVATARIGGDIVRLDCYWAYQQQPCENLL